MSKVLSIDFGLKRVGFAVGNTMLGIASPIEPIQRKDSQQVIHHIQFLITDYDISRIIIGYPLHMDGSPSAMTQQVEHFTRRLKKSLAPFEAIEFIDERLSSLEADEELKSLHSKPKKRKTHLDSMAAVILLNRYLETAENKRLREYNDEIEEEEDE